MRETFFFLKTLWISVRQCVFFFIIAKGFNHVIFEFSHRKSNKSGEYPIRLPSSSTPCESVLFCKNKKTSVSVFHLSRTPKRDLSLASVGVPGPGSKHLSPPPIIPCSIDPIDGPIVPGQLLCALGAVQGFRGRRRQRGPTTRW